VKTSRATSATRAAGRRFRRRTCALVGAVLLAVLLSIALLPAVAEAGSLASRISSTLSRYGMGGSRSAVTVWNLETGRMVFYRNVHRAMTPASNQKLATAAAALEHWGTDHRFRTEVLVKGGPDGNGVVHGDLYLKGYGDPTLSTTRYQERVFRVKTSNLGRLAAAVRRAGVRRVTGRIIGDESYFDRRRTVSSWRTGMSAFCGPLSALAVDQGYSGGRRVSQPASHAAKAFRTALRANGVRVDGGVRVATTPGSATVIATEESAPLWRILRLMNKPSDNTIAEMLVKGLGRKVRGRGTTADGAAVVRKFLLDAGAPSREVRVRDGSGLSYLNQMSPLAVSRLLVTMSGRLDFDFYWNSLAVAGRSGTLRQRLRGTAAAANVHAKTGTLSISSCLSGYVTTRGREGVVFCIMMNGSFLPTWQARQAQDAIAALLARSDL